MDPTNTRAGGEANRGEHGDLEAERNFLLRSLDDLDSELTAGNIDPDSYRELHDDYTARAAAVIKRLDDREVFLAAAEVPKASRLVRYTTIGGIVVFVAIASYFLAHAAGQRHPGQTPTGNGQVASAGTVRADVVATAKAAADAQPNSYDARIAYARALVSVQNFPDAIEQYVEAAKLDPTQPEPLAYSGWISALVARQVTDANAKKSLLQAATDRLDQAITIAPTYADSYVFKGLLLSQIENRPCEAVPVFQQYLVLAPQAHPLRNQVLQALSDAIASGKCPTTNTVKP